MTAQSDTMKLDYEVTQTQLEAANSELARLKKMMKDASAKYKGMEKERDESRMMLRALRSNEQAENDRVKKAVRDAEAPKDAIIAELMGEMDKRNHDRRIDEANIRELSRMNNEYKVKNLDLKTSESRIATLEKTVEKKNEEIRELKARMVSFFQFTSYPAYPA